MAINPGSNLNSTPAMSNKYYNQIILTLLQQPIKVGRSNFYQILWHKKLKFSDRELYQDFFHK